MSDFLQLPYQILNISMIITEWHTKLALINGNKISMLVFCNVIISVIITVCLRIYRKIFTGRFEEFNDTRSDKTMPEISHQDHVMFFNCILQVRKYFFLQLLINMLIIHKCYLKQLNVKISIQV